ncbi:MAG: hypothetical protein RMM06_02260 [Armatimonadota bacterium]|nr:hypothetical protein [bacterium]MDW8289520.1 hypothetical protein [Armatimonadota bacterium]
MGEKVYLSATDQTGNFWIDNGLAYLLEQFGEGEHSSDEIMQHLLSKLVQPTGNKGLYYDQRSGQLREYEKCNWLEPANLFIKVAGDSGKKEEIGNKKYPTQPPQFNLEISLSKKEEQCDICGQLGLITSAKMWIYPFVVDPAKFANFYSGGKRGLKLCARCALAGVAGYLSWWWCRQGDNALHFFLFHADLPELLRLHRDVMSPLSLRRGRGGNVPHTFLGKYLHETVLGVLLALFSHIPSSEVLSDEARQYLASLFAGTTPATSPVVLYAVTGVPAQAFDMKQLKEFSRLQQLFRLYEQWTKIVVDRYGAANPHQQIVRILEQFWVQRQRERETIWRDRIAQAVLELSDPLPTIEEFLFDIRAKEESPRPLRQGTEEILLDNYSKEVSQMDEDFIKALSSFGRRLGEAAQAGNERGLLYSLRNAKNVEEFYRVLNDIQFRLSLTVPESLLKLEKGERIAGAPWKRVKHMLAIYSMNAYLRKERYGEKPEETEED